MKKPLATILIAILVAVFAAPQSALAANTHSIDFERSSSQYDSIADASQTGLNFTGDHTIELWWKPESVNVDQFFISRDGSTDRGWAFWYEHTADKLEYYYHQNSSASSNRRTTTAIGATAGTWMHIAVAVDVSTGNMDFYINGTKNVGTGGAQDATSQQNISVALQIGVRDRGTPSGFVDGLIDDVRVWSDIRTSTEISSNRETELAGNEANLVAYFKFNNNHEDATTNANHLTANNSPVFSTDVPFTGASGGGVSPVSLGISYTYDAVGNITAITDTGSTGAGRTVGYTYDALGRLTAASTTAASSTPYSDTYTYNAIGNITQMVRSAR